MERREPDDGVRAHRRAPRGVRGLRRRVPGRRRGRRPQAGDFYGGGSRGVVKGPSKGGDGTLGWRPARQWAGGYSDLSRASVSLRGSWPDDLEALEEHRERSLHVIPSKSQLRAKKSRWTARQCSSVRSPPPSSYAAPRRRRRTDRRGPRWPARCARPAVAAEDDPEIARFGRRHGVAVLASRHAVARFMPPSTRSTSSSPSRSCHRTCRPGAHARAGYRWRDSTRPTPRRRRRTRVPGPVTGRRRPAMPATLPKARSTAPGEAHRFMTNCACETRAWRSCSRSRVGAPNRNSAADDVLVEDGAPVARRSCSSRACCRSARPGCSSRPCASRACASARCRSCSVPATASVDAGQLSVVAVIDDVATMLDRNRARRSLARSGRAGRSR